MHERLRIRALLRSGGRAAVTTLAAAALPLAGVAALGVYGVTMAESARSVDPLWNAALLWGGGAVLCGLALVPTHALALAAGWLLGPLWGALVAWVAVITATALAYGVGRRLTGVGLVEAVRERPRWRVVHGALIGTSARRTAVLVALLRLSPLAPFAATNVALAGVGVPAGSFLLGSILGLTPRVLVVASLGAGMAELDYSKPQAPWLAALGAGATVIALACAGWVASVALRRMTADSAGNAGAVASQVPAVGGATMPEP